MLQFLEDFVETLATEELRSTANHQMNDEAEVAYSDDLVEQAVVASTQQVAEEVILQEQTLDDVTAHLASLIIDTQIRESADEELKSYIYQVEVTD